MKILTSLVILIVFSTPNLMSQTLKDLKEGQKLNDFTVLYSYLNERGQPIGARFVHSTGFNLHLLTMDTVAQASLWVNSFPTSDMGEPHTQEHLLLGKGSKGRERSDFEEMSLVNSSAFTMQWRTVYHFHTVAGEDVFFRSLEKQLDALINPDYTDEEIRREVRNFGVVRDAGGQLSLEEKGTVYNEMVSTFNQPSSRLWRALTMALYGKEHPLAFSAGGFPEAIRRMEPEHIRKFHNENYHLANMSVVAVLPRADNNALESFDRILKKFKSSGQKIRTEDDLPAPLTRPGDSIEIVTYPHKNEQQPGTLLFAWPPSLSIDLRELLLLRLVLENLAGDATTNLYKRFIDTRTREIDLGARGVSSYVSYEQGFPVSISLTDVSAQNLNEERIRLVRSKILDEIRRITLWKDGSQELKEFNQRLSNRVIELRREMVKFVNSPPGFGFRGTGPEWIVHLHMLSGSGFRKDLTFTDELRFIEEKLKSDKNIWREYIEKFKLLEPPISFATKADPSLILLEEKEKSERIHAEIARLKAKYSISDRDAAIVEYEKEYQRLSEVDSKAYTPPRFLESPPLTLDDPLKFHVGTVAGVKNVVSNFQMSGGRVGIAFDLRRISDTDLLYISILPDLLTGTGVIKGGRPISFEEMTERLKREILSLRSYFTNNPRTDRTELVLSASGNDTDETRRAIDWIALCLHSPDWRPENLARIRDLVDQRLGALRNTTQSREEIWVQTVANAYWKQSNSLYLATTSFLTRAHNLHRLKWLLREPVRGREAEALIKFVADLEAAPQKMGREQLKALLLDLKGDKQLPLAPEARAHVKEMATDIEQIVPFIPDNSLASDSLYLCKQMLSDLKTEPKEVLQRLNGLRRRVVNRKNARLFTVASTETVESINSPIKTLVNQLEDLTLEEVKSTSVPLVTTRLSTREKVEKNPVFVGFVNPNSSSGVFVNSVASASYHETETETLLDFLGSKLYSGGGAHSIFMKTWAAGLAYSNGLRSNPSTGRLTYYAERVPKLPQTLGFVIDELKSAKEQPELVEYAIAQSFGEIRSASSYEERAEAIAADLADGLTPDVVRNFRQNILRLRNLKNLSSTIFERMKRVYANVLPGFEKSYREDAIYFVIGPESQLKEYEQYLQSVYGKQTTLYRLYPRDFWLP